VGRWVTKCDPVPCLARTRHCYAIECLQYYAVVICTHGTNCWWITHLEQIMNAKLLCPRRTGAFWSSTVRPSVCPMVQLPRHAGCLQLSHRRPPEMCCLWTRPRTDLNLPRFLPPSNCHIVSDLVVSCRHAVDRHPAMKKHN